MISQKSVQEILETARVEEVIEDYVNLKRSGSNLKGLCPFHNEKTPSFMVSPAKNIYKCFGCGKAGNSVQFIMEHESLSFPEALKSLAKKYNIHVEETVHKPIDESEKLREDSLYLVNRFGSDYFKNNLWNTTEGKSIGLSYFKERGFLEKTIQKFELGYSLKSSAAFTQYAVQNSYNIELLRELGLTSANDFDFFRERVIFPIHNLSGKIIAFGARTLSSNPRVPKYLNSPESDIYSKSKSLYGIYFAKAPIRKMDECLLVEGYTDVLSLHQAGIENVISSSGTSLTDGQIQLIKRYTRNIKIIYDGDQAGIKAALRGIDLLLAQDMDVRLVLLPEKEDPDSLLRRLGSQAFNSYLIDQAKDFILFKANMLSEEAKHDPIKKSKLLKDIVKSISLIPDQLKKSLYIRECSKLMEVDEDVLVGELNKTLRAELHKKKNIRPQRVPFKDQNQTTSPRLKSGSEYKQLETGDEYQERDVIRNLICHGDKYYNDEEKITMAEYILANISDIIDSFENEFYKTIIEETQLMLDASKNVNEQAYINHTNREISQFAIDILSSPFEYANWEEKGYYLQTQKKPENNFIKDSLQAIMRLKERKLVKTKTEIDNRIKAFQNGSDEELQLLIRARLKIQSMISEIQISLGTVVPSK